MLRAKQPAQQALEISGEIGDVAREARSSFLMFMLRRENFERISAQRYLVNAVELARSAGLRRELAEYLSHPIWLFIDNSDYDTRLAAGLETVALSKEIADKRLEMEVTVHLAEFYLWHKEPDEAQSIAEAVLQLSTEIGDIDCQLKTLYTLAITKVEVGLLDEAEALISTEKGIAEYEKIGGVRFHIRQNIYSS